MLHVGQRAPDFTLFDSEKKQLSLSSLEGQTVLLLFYPFAFSSTCTRQLCDVREHMNWYNEVEAKVIGISVDSIYTLARYKADQHLNFTLLSDFNKEVSSLYGTIYETFSYGMKGVSKRSAFVIDKTGIIRYLEILENAGEIPNVEAIRGALTTCNQNLS